jgi:iron-sulfur cluster insertion protein
MIDLSTQLTDNIYSANNIRIPGEFVTELYKEISIPKPLNINNEAPLHLSPSAIDRLQELLIEKKNDNLKFRVYIVGGGCSGFQYGFSFDEMINEDDLKLETMGTQKKIITLVDSLSAQYLEDATVDYKVSLQGSRFVVENPNAETTCGCGSSFSLKEN